MSITVGELMDVFEEKLRTGEINREDRLMIEGQPDVDGEESDWYPVVDIRKSDSATVVLEIDAAFGWQP